MLAFSARDCALLRTARSTVTPFKSRVPTATSAVSFRIWIWPSTCASPNLGCTAANNDESIDVRHGGVQTMEFVLVSNRGGNVICRQLSGSLACREARGTLEDDHFGLDGRSTKNHKRPHDAPRNGDDVCHSALLFSHDHHFQGAL